MIEDVGELVQVRGFVPDQGGCCVGRKFAVYVAGRTRIIRRICLQAARGELRNHLLLLLIEVRVCDAMRKVLYREEAGAALRDGNPHGAEPGAENVGAMPGRVHPHRVYDSGIWADRDVLSDDAEIGRAHV